MKQSVLIVWLIGLETLMAQAQPTRITSSGLVRARQNKSVLPYVHVVLSTPKDSAFLAGTVTDQAGRFMLNDVPPPITGCPFLSWDTGLIPR